MATIRLFLQTAILDRLHGPLCDTVTGDEGGSARLEALHRGNFFVVPLDDTRQWYRYHHLFADVLQAQLRAEHPELVAVLHRRASAWYEQNGSAADAIRHALAARDYHHVADLVELAAPAAHQRRQEATLLGWYRALPDEVVRSRPVLSVGYAGALLACGEVSGVEERLRDAERCLAPLADGADRLAAMVVQDEAAFPRLPTVIAVYRGGHALALGNVSAAMAYARQALDRMAEDEHHWRGAATAILGLASWASGNLEAAYQLYADGMARLRKAGNIADAIGGSITLADIRVTQARLREARRTYEQGLQLAAEHGAPQIRGTADMHVGLSELSREHGDLQAAAQHLQRSQEQGEHTGFPQHPHRWRVALARLRAAQGDLDDALDLLEEAERRYMADFSPNVRPVAAWKARLWLAQGRLDDALGWARERGLAAHDELSYLREFEHITLARVLLARSRHDPVGGSLPETIDLLGRLLAAAEAGGRTGSVLEILVLLALAHQARGDLPAALAALSHALTLAEPEGYVQLFMDEGPPLTALLEAAAKQGVAPGYARQLLAAFGVAEERAPATGGLVEPLSERERDVLRLLRTELDGPELAGFAGYVLGGLLFGVATVRAAVLPRWPAVLLAASAVLPPLLSWLLPHPLDRMMVLPMGLALAWLGYALWLERRASVVEPAPGTARPQLHHSAD